MIDRSDMIKRPAYKSAVAPNGGGERKLLLLVAARSAEEDAALDAESILEQAEEANTLDPVG